jgi:hypothetical protein
LIGTQSFANHDAAWLQRCSWIRETIPASTCLVPTCGLATQYARLPRQLYAHLALFASTICVSTRGSLYCKLRVQVGTYNTAAFSTALSCPVLPFLSFPLHTSLFPVTASSSSEETFCCTKMHSEESDPAMFCALCWFSAWNLPLGDLVWKWGLTSFRVPCDHGCVRCIRHRYGVLCDTEFGSHLGGEHLYF